MQCESREAGRARSGGGGNSFSPLTPFPCRRRSFQSSVIFGKISSSDLVQWLQSPSWRGGPGRGPLTYFFGPGLLVGKKKKAERFLIFQTPFKEKPHWRYFPRHRRGFAQTRKRIFA